MSSTCRDKSMAPNNDDKVSTVNYIPDDVSFAILSKLSLKSLNRFSCACKSWSLLLQNPNFLKMFCKHFISMHQSLYNDTHVFLNIKEILPFPQDGSNLYLLSGDKFENKIRLNWPVSVPQDEIYTNMLDSGVNDILCLSDLDDEFVSLWNPITKELETVSPSPAQLPRFGHSNVFHLHGYGYDHVNDDYKIIRYVHVYQYGHNDFDWTYMPLTPRPFWEIYSVRRNSWRRLNLDMPTSIGRKVYLNGLCHWWAYTDLDDDAYMVSFNLSNGVFFTTRLPLDMQDSYPDEWVKRETDYAERAERYFDLVVLNGFVAMIAKHVKTASFHIYVLSELGVGESWTKLLIIGPLPSVERPVGVGKKGDLYFIKNDNELACFDLSTQTIEDMAIKGQPFCCHFAVYKQSLHPISLRNLFQL